jgi:hypothetical protein
LRPKKDIFNVFSFIFFFQGEPEILSILPTLHTSLDSDKTSPECATSLPRLVFTANTTLNEQVRDAALGHITLANEDIKEPDVKTNNEDDVSLTFMTSFYARTREDLCDPLLTDLVLLPTGDVIMTDRDNKYIKH